MLAWGNLSKVGTFLTQLCLAYLVCFEGRVDPVPFELKDDHMGLGRWTLEVLTLTFLYPNLI